MVYVNKKKCYGFLTLLIFDEKYWRRVQAVARIIKSFNYHALSQLKVRQFAYIEIYVSFFAQNHPQPLLIS